MVQVLTVVRYSNSSPLPKAKGFEPYERSELGENGTGLERPLRASFADAISAPAPHHLSLGSASPRQEKESSPYGRGEPQFPGKRLRHLKSQ